MPVTGSVSPTATPAGTPTELAAAANAAFHPIAHRLAEQVAQGAMVHFRPGKSLTSLAVWFRDPADQLLAVVVGPHASLEVADEVLAYALAWQYDRDLVLVLPERQIGLTTERLPWIGTPVRVFTYGTDFLVAPAIVPSRAEVLAAAGTRPLRSKGMHDLQDPGGWVAAVIQGADDHWALVEAHRHSYLAWHCRGQQVLRISRGGHCIRVVAGVNYSHPKVDQIEPVTLDVAGAVTALERAKVEAAVASAVRERLADRDRGYLEHRLQAALAATGLRDLGLTGFAREYPAWRGDGRPGYVDFLGLDRRNRLHVVETKVGTADVKGVLQALDYATWVTANAAAIRAERYWPEGPADERVIIDFVLSPGASGQAVGPYLAGQLEALAGDVAWQLAIVSDPMAETPRFCDGFPMWRSSPMPGPMVAAPVQPPRWAARTTTALRNRQP